MSEIINKVAQSGIITLDPADYIHPGNITELDIAPVLWQGLVLKEKDFRNYISTSDWTPYSGKDVAVFCSADAIIPSWAFMLITAALQPYARNIFFGTRASLINELIRSSVRDLDANEFKDLRVVVKGCSDFELDPSVYIEISKKLLPVVKSLMFGEACSTVPVFKRK